MLGGKWLAGLGYLTEELPERLGPLLVRLGLVLVDRLSRVKLLADRLFTDLLVLFGPPAVGSE